MRTAVADHCAPALEDLLRRRVVPHDEGPRPAGVPVRVPHLDERHAGEALQQTVDVLREGSGADLAGGVQNGPVEV